MVKMDVKNIRNKVISGVELTEAEAMSLCEAETDELLEAAADVTAHFFTDKVFDTCSIINARSGRCPENCKWCAQSAHYQTDCDTYQLVDKEVCVDLGRFYDENGVKRYSLVTSGKKMHGEALEKVCAMYDEMRGSLGIKLCASMGLLDGDELKKLKEHGVSRYHCNMESAPSHFSKLCSTHTQEDKLRTIEAAREAGIEICSGGIIGMGESEAQRAEFALFLRSIRPASIPINILCPIPGTPLEGQAPLTEDEILRTVAIFRLVNPRTVLRFAGGRKKLSREGQLRAIRAGINGAIVGDLLTTVGSRIAEDRELAAEAGMRF